MAVRSNEEIIYWIVRAGILAVGFLIFAAGVILTISLFFERKSYDPQDGSMTVDIVRWYDYALSLLTVIYGLYLLAPNRWFVRQPFYALRMIVFGVVLLLLIGFTVESMMRRKYPDLIGDAISFGLILLNLILPITLWWKRRLLAKTD